MISPSSPRVQVTSVTGTPAAAYRAMVAPVSIDSSSGWACTSSSPPPVSGVLTPSETSWRPAVARPGGKIRAMTESFPRQQARTRRFSLGVPRSFMVAPDGSRVAFLRSKGADDPVTCLWQLHVETGQEELVADPAALDPAGEDLSPQEKARRERAREQSGGIVGFAADRALSVAAFALAGRVYVTGLDPSGGQDDAGAREAAGVQDEAGAREAAGTREAAGGQTGPRLAGALAPAFDPRPDPTGTRVAYVHQGALHVTRIDGEARGAGDTSGADAASGDAVQRARCGQRARCSCGW